MIIKFESRCSQLMFSVHVHIHSHHCGPNNNEIHVHSIARNKPLFVIINVLQTELFCADQIHVVSCNIAFALMIEYFSTVYLTCNTDSH
jgi:hypothetical protein